ncbi:MAG TPA: hypothetical protein VG796_12820 [Verrucomicrobiales bacterium]|nr:hypothetical protein [Verrucomicrobiales bacterium]
MRFRFPICLVAGLLLLWLPLGNRLWAQDPNERAARLLGPLAKRPSSGLLFERFVNAWLETDTLDGLEKYLAGRVASEPSAANRLLLALFYARQSAPVKALQEFRAALTLDPGSADIWYQKARLESRILDFDAAIASLGNCLAAKPPAPLSVQAAQLLGRLQARAGKPEEALQTWRTLMEAQPENEELREDVLELQIAESLWPAAQETAAALVEKTSDPYRRVLRRMRLGDVFDRSGQREKALDTFSSCLAETGEGSWLEKEILSQMERLFRREDDVAGLKAWFGRLLMAHGRRPGLQRAQARLLMETGETDAAIACGRALLALSPGDRTVREEFIALLSNAGRAADAIPQVEELLRQTPNDFELHLTLADLKHAVKDTAGALAELRLYGQKTAAQEDSTLRVAGLMDRYGATGEAIETLRTALSRNQDQPDVRLMMASLLHHSGKRDEALAEWRRLAQGDSLPAVQQTARAMHAHGEAAEAWQVMQTAAPKAASDPVFLTQLCSLADNAERARAAVLSARRLVELAKSATDLNHALDIAQRVVRLSENADGIIAELAQSASTAQGLCLLATLREAARDTGGADAALEKARALSPELALTQLVRLWTMRGDFARAAAEAEQLFNSPGGKQGYIAEMLASLHQRAGNPEVALKWTREWRKLMPGAPAPALNEARMLQAAGRYSEALTTLRSAAGRFEGNDDIRACLAAANLQSGRSAEALRLYSTLYEDATDLAAKMRWVQAWGQAAHETGRLEELVAQFEERRRENRQSIVPLMALAELHRIANDYEARRRALTEAARLKPEDLEITLEIARLEAREENYEAAIQTLKPVLAKDRSGKAAVLLADLLLTTGREEEGLKLLHENAVQSPESVENTVITLARRGEEKTALTFLRPRLPAWPDDWRLSFLAALLEWRTHQIPEATERLLSLASVSAPLARAGSVASSLSVPGYEESVIRIMPPETQRFLRLAQAMEADSVSNIRRFNYNELPSDPVELQNLSAALLLVIARSSSPEKGAELTAALERRGFSFARLIPELPAMRGLILEDRSEDFSLLRRENPDSRPLLAVAALNDAYRDWSEPADPAMAERAWSAFRESAPEAALFLALPGAGQKAEPAVWEQQVMAALESQGQASPLLLRALVRCLGFAYSDDDWDRRTQMPPAWRKRQLILVQQWQRALDDSQVAPGFARDLHEAVFRGMVREYSKSKDYASLAALLDAEWRWQESRPQSPARRSVSSDEPLAQPLGFPPAIVPGVASTLRHFAGETAGPTAPLMHRPELKFLLLAKSPAGATRAALDEMLKAQTGTAAPFVLAAAWEEKSGNFAAAAEMAAKALFLPVTQEVRRALDGALVFWASRKAKPGDALYLAGREAALRLRRDAVTSDLRTDLAKLMDTLGLTEEADRLMRQGKSREKQTAGTAMERARRLLEEGRQKEAMPVLLAELRNWARQRSAGGALISGTELKFWRTLVQVHGLLAEVMRAMLPVNATPQQMAEYGAACEITGDLKNAREFYERAIAGGVKKNLRRILVPLLVREDAGKAVALLREMPEAWTEDGYLLWAKPFLQRVDRIDRLEEVLEFGSLVERMIDVMPENAAAEFPVDSIIGIMEGDCRAGEMHTVSELSEGSKVAAYWDRPAPAAETARIEAMTKERIAVIERICRKLLNRPGCELEAWGQLRFLRIYQKKDPSEMAAEGIAILVRELTPGLERTAKRSNESGDEVQTTLNLLMQDTAKSGHTADFSRDVVPAIKATFSLAAAERLLENWPLYESSAEGFAEAARALLKARGVKAWSDVTDAAMERELGAELAPDLLRLCAAADNKELEPVAWRIPAWGQLIEKIQGRAAAEAFIRAALDALLGPIAERPDSLKNGSGNQRPELLKRILFPLIDAKEWIAFAMRYLRDEVLPYLPENSAGLFDSRQDYIIEPVRQLTAFLEKDDLKGARAWLDSLPVTEDLPGFYGGSGIMMTLANTLARVPDAKLDALGFGGDRSKLTFGRQALLAARSWYDGYCDALSGWQSRLEALPEPHKRRILTDLRSFEGSLDEDTDPGSLAFYEWLCGESIARGKEETKFSVEKFFKDADANAFADAGALDREVRTLLFRMARELHPRGREVIRRSCRMLAAFGDDKAQDDLVKIAVNLVANPQPQLSPRQVAWLTGVLAEALHESGAGSEFYKYWRSNTGATLLDGPNGSIADRLENFVTLLGPVLHPGEARLLVLWLLNDRTLTRKDLADGLGWISKNGRRFPWRELVLEMETALRFLKASDGGTGRRNVLDEAKIPAEQRHYLEILRDASLPVRLRLTMALSLAHIGSPAVEPPLMLECARLLRHALEERGSITTKEEAEAFEVLMEVPPAARDAELVKALVSHTTLSRLRSNDGIRRELSEGLSALMDLALSCGDTSTVDRLLEMDNGYPDFSAVTILTHHGEGKRLAELIRREPDVLQKIDYTTARFDSTLQTRLPEVLNDIADPTLRFEAFALLNALRDADSEAPETKPPSKRMEGISATFAATEWKNLEAKDRLLSGMIKLGDWALFEPGLAFSAAVDESVSRVPASTLLSLDETARKRCMLFHFTAVYKAAAAGNFEPLRSTLEKVTDISGDDEMGIFPENLFDYAGRAIFESWPNLLEPDRAAACAGWRAVMADAVTRNRWAEWREALQFGILLHALAEKMPELYGWHAALPETTRFLMSVALAHRDTESILPNNASTFARIAGTPEEKAARRAAVFSALVENPLGGSPPCTLYQDFMDMDGATEVEFLKLEKPLTRARPDDGWLVVAFARARAATGAWDLVLERTSAALAKGKPSLETAWAPLLELRTLALENTGHPGATTAEIRALQRLPEPSTGDPAGIRARSAAWRLLRRLAR